MYRLFSQMNSTGRDQTAAMLSASWKAPILVAPSPKNATATWSLPRSLADQAAPAASGRCAPTIAYDPSIPADALVRCIEPPLALHKPVALLTSPARNRSCAAFSVLRITAICSYSASSSLAPIVSGAAGGVVIGPFLRLPRRRPARPRRD